MIRGLGRSMPLIVCVEPRCAQLVELAYAHDPRVKAHVAAQKEEKARAKSERAARAAREKEEEAKAKAAALAQEQKEKEEAAAREKEEAAERKKQKERLQKALRKSRARLRALCKDHVRPVVTRRH